MFPKKHELLKLDFLSSPGKPTGCERFSGLSSRNSTDSYHQFTKKISFYIFSKNHKKSISKKIYA